MIPCYPRGRPGRIALSTPAPAKRPNPIALSTPAPVKRPVPIALRWYQTETLVPALNETMVPEQ